MKKSKLIGLILLLIGVALSFVYAFVFSDPEVRVYRFGQNIDNGIADASLLMDTSREDLLNLLQRDVGDLIQIGREYEPGLNIEREFGYFRETFAMLEEYSARVIPRIAAIYERADFEAHSRRAARVRGHRDLAENFVLQQEDRVGKLVRFNAALLELTEQLKEFETNFYESDPWVSVPYFQSLMDQFDLIADLHEEYLEAVSTYARTKTRFYLAIREDL